MRKLVWTVLLVAVLGVCALFLFWPGRGAPVVVDVEEGTTPRRVAANLVERKLLMSEVPFLVWVRLRNADQNFHVGRYQFSSGRSAYWMVDDIVHGRTQKSRIVIPEGWASWQIAERLEAAGVCNGPGFLAFVKEKKMEGYLFPATYDLDVALRPATVAGRMKTKFEESWTEEMESRAREAGLTRHQTVTLASIVEREVRVRDEAPMIAALYLNRLKKGMPLQADPTVQYGKGEWVTRLTYADYRNTDSPYNTYRITGLPPGPICSPGLDSIKAVLWPANSNALYIVAAEDGRHLFSETYRDHVNKVNRRNRERRRQRTQ